MPAHRVTSEDLLRDVVTRYEFPKKRLCRVYEPWVTPVEPSPFKYSFVAAIQESGLCEIKALANQGDKITKGDLAAAAEHLRHHGAKILHWRHGGQEHQLIIPCRSGLPK